MVSVVIFKVVPCRRCMIQVEPSEARMSTRLEAVACTIRRTDSGFLLKATKRTEFDVVLDVDSLHGTQSATSWGECRNTAQRHPQLSGTRAPCLRWWHDPQRKSGQRQTAPGPQSWKSCRLVRTTFRSSVQFKKPALMLTVACLSGCSQNGSATYVCVDLHMNI